jgi:hypothetical protein
MNNHDNHPPAYREIIKYEGKIVELFNHNVHKYKYVGEEGKEYEVIQSVFNEINHLPGLSNKHIRSYAIIIWKPFGMGLFLDPPGIRTYIECIGISTQPFCLSQPGMMG